VTPGNTIPVEQLGAGQFRQLRSGSCPATFQPARRSWLRRWNLSFSIGQAF
jgi:hypothetical protein